MYIYILIPVSQYATCQSTYLYMLLTSALAPRCGERRAAGLRPCASFSSSTTSRTDKRRVARWYSDAPAAVPGALIGLPPVAPVKPGTPACESALSVLQAESHTKE